MNGVRNAAALPVVDPLDEPAAPLPRISPVRRHLPIAD
ncbi:hypothetical protein SAMN05444858_1522 [Micromonospora avicenniae]|uniref:Uncharacterized protein n=1 Tax=Micromonospora avicenniae TaxID=1198245 RepID=A0A1N7FV54_9ACTN|nr:hypothetical protein SAMN05444858_1522 [Micromonospora avicenniae]